MFVIYKEDGYHSEYSMTNLFVVEAEELAMNIVDSLKKANEIMCKFRNNELQNWIIQYKTEHPEPTFIPQVHSKMTMPQSPRHLRDLSKQERKFDPEYQNFLKTLREHEAWQERVDLAEVNRRKAFDSIWNEWNAGFNSERIKFIETNLNPVLEKLFPVDLADKLMKFVSAGHDCRYSFDKLEIL